jgi:hypothetical protein
MINTAIPLLLLLALVSGCSTSYIAKGDLKAYNSRFIWSTEGFEAEFATNGTGKVKIHKSNPDAQTAGAVAEGVARGLGK